MRFLRKSPGNKSPLLLPARKVAYGPVSKFKDIHLNHCIKHNAIFIFCISFKPSPTVISAHLYDIPDCHRERPVDFFPLRNECDAIKMVPKGLSMDKYFSVLG